mmetsp:Transcript_59437/g.126361  ORF Transcript_59437/g.126361 Transcript_59437/m.126361 type:complete len:221 (-) Transcript_59437:909-1571(-)
MPHVQDAARLNSRGGGGHGRHGRLHRGGCGYNGLGQRHGLRLRHGLGRAHREGANGRGMRDDVHRRLRLLLFLLKRLGLRRRLRRLVEDGLPPRRVDVRPVHRGGKNAVQRRHAKRGVRLHWLRLRLWLWLWLGLHRKGLLHRHRNLLWLFRNDNLWLSRLGLLEHFRFRSEGERRRCRRGRRHTDRLLLRQNQVRPALGTPYVARRRDGHGRRRPRRGC